MCHNMRAEKIQHLCLAKGCGCHTKIDKNPRGKLSGLNKIKYLLFKHLHAKKRDFGRI